MQINFSRFAALSFRQFDQAAGSVFSFSLILSYLLIRLALDFSSSPAFLILMVLPAVIMEKALPRAVCPEACLPAGPIKPLDLLLTADNDLKNRPETFSGKDHAKKRAVKTSCLLGSRTLS